MTGGKHTSRSECREDAGPSTSVVDISPSPSGPVMTFHATCTKNATGERKQTEQQVPYAAVQHSELRKSLADSVDTKATQVTIPFHASRPIAWIKLNSQKGAFTLSDAALGLEVCCACPMQQIYVVELSIHSVLCVYGTALRMTAKLRKCFLSQCAQIDVCAPGTLLRQCAGISVQMDA